ncbi:MAG: DUF309 domain-containing protein [Chloroflexi bacterium]|nr:DUF309 domain-containing protein [Chloroflexota bacterium]MQC18852.1 DUF309 domain-containing protein [Chloroflexota bacterium]
MTNPADGPSGVWPPPLDPKAPRPRDEAGRPLPEGTATRLVLPDFDAMSIDEGHEAARDFFDEGNYFGAHEAWETCWARCKGTGDEEFFKGLAQLGAGYTHWLRGNAHGVNALLSRALERIGRHGSPHRGIDIAEFMEMVEEVRATAARCETAGEPLPALERRLVPRA